MNIWDQVSLYLPGLRRHAVNITGSLSLADKYLEQMLNSIIENPGLVAPETMQLDLYKNLLSIWRQQKRPTQLIEKQYSEKPALLAALHYLEPDPRFLILLNKCEGFDYQECSYIMNLSASEIEANLAEIAAKLKQLTEPAKDKI